MGFPSVRSAAIEPSANLFPVTSLSLSLSLSLSARINLQRVSRRIKFPSFVEHGETSQQCLKSVARPPWIRSHASQEIHPVIPSLKRAFLWQCSCCLVDPNCHGTALFNAGKDITASILRATRDTGYLHQALRIFCRTENPNFANYHHSKYSIKYSIGWPIPKLARWQAIL